MKFLLTQFNFFSLDAPAFSLTKHNLSRQLPSELPANLLNACLTWVRRGGLSHFRSGNGRRSLPCTPQGVHGCGCHAWQPATSRQTDRPRRNSHVGRSPSMRSRCHQAGLILRSTGISTSQQEQLRICQGTIFLLHCGEVLARLGQQLLPSLHKGSIRSSSGNCLQGLTSDLVCSSPEACAGRGGALWRMSMPLVRGKTQHSDSTSYSSTVVHCVQSLYINHYVCSDKPVLS
jgi:hypothetical protein